MTDDQARGIALAEGSLDPLAPAVVLTTGASPPAAVATTVVPDEAIFPVLATGLGWLGAAGLSVGLFFGTVVWRDALPTYISANQIPLGQRLGILAMMAVGLLLGVVPALAHLRRRRSAGLETVQQWALTLSPLCLLGFVPTLLNLSGWRGWANNDLSVTILISLVSVLGVTTVSQSLAQPAVFRDGWDARLRKAVAFFAARPNLATAGVVAAGVFYATWFSAFTLSNHFNLYTSAYDLGIEDNLLWNAFRNAQLFHTTPIGGNFTHIAYHQTYFSFLLAIPYLLFPDARFLLIFQAVWLGAGTIPLYLFARNHLGPWIGCLIVWLFVLYPPLHGANMYDFHYQPLSIPLLFGFLYCIERKFHWRALIVAVVTLSLREDMGLLLAVLCVWLALMGHRPKVTLSIAGLGLAHFVLLKLIIMPRFLGGGESFLNQYRALVPEGLSGFGGVITTALANPGYTVAWLIEPGKQLYLLQILGPLLFLPLVRRANLVLLLPGFFFTLLSTSYPALISTAFQYTAYWIPFVFIGMVTTLANLWSTHRRLAISLLIVMPMAMVFHSRHFGDVLKTENGRGSFHTTMHLIPTATDRQNHSDLYELIAMIPGEGKVSASEMLIPHVSARAAAYTLRNGYIDAEWILATLPRGDELPQLREALGAGKEFGVVAIRGIFVLAQKGHSQDQNAAAQHLLGY